jgi:hypothetical protein
MVGGHSGELNAMQSINRVWSRGYNVLWMNIGRKEAV